jgi:hypothetical protein
MRSVDIMAKRIKPYLERKTEIVRAAIGILLILLTSLTGVTIKAQENTSSHNGDTHYNDVGFFDIHLCNWPDRPQHIMALFSTTQFDDLGSVEILMPNQKPVGFLELSKYRIIQTKDKKEKHVFIRRFDMPSDAGDGWYSAKITMKNGKTYFAKDYVINQAMPWLTVINPHNGAENIPMPTELSWKPIPGAKYYQVFINDVWKAKQIYASKLLDKPNLKLPKNLIEPGGEYEWRIHAREGNENILLGDFNNGTLTKAASFSVSE